jgi:hypothetical protein
MLFRDGRPTSARWATRNGDENGEIAFDYLIDASGRAAVMATRYLRNRRLNHGFKSVAAYSYWVGTKTPKQGPPGSILIASIQDGWI